MSPRKSSVPDPAQTREAVLSVVEKYPEVDRAELALAVRLSARTIAHLAPGKTVELRIPPFVAVQCIEGPAHTRGTPPNVVECDAATWLRLCTAQLDFVEAVAQGVVSASGARAGELAHWLPIISM